MLFVTDHTAASGYQAVPTSSPYEYGASAGRSFPVAMTSPAHESGQDSYAATTAHGEQPGLFSCDDTAVAHYMQNYPPLQPGRPSGDQPTTRREGMFYPEGLPTPAAAAGDYFKTEEAGRIAAAGLSGMRPDAAMASRPGYSSDLIPVAGAGPLARPPQMGTAPARYAVLHGYGNSDPMVQEDRSGGASSLDVVFPDQKAPAAKRGPFKDHDSRQKTAQTRKIGSCIRCRMQRIRVS